MPSPGWVCLMHRVHRDLAVNTTRQKLHLVPYSPLSCCPQARSQHFTLSLQFSHQSTAKSVHGMEWTCLHLDVRICQNVWETTAMKDSGRNRTFACTTIQIAPAYPCQTRPHDRWNSISGKGWPKKKKAVTARSCHPICLICFNR